MGHVAPQLRNARGRLDARQVAEAFGLSLAEVSRIAGRSLSTVHKTPDAPSLQHALAPCERIAVALRPLAGSEAAMRMWLHAPNPELDGRTPVDLLRGGQGAVVAELLEDALVGQPG